MTLAFSPYSLAISTKSTVPSFTALSIAARAHWAEWEVPEDRP